MSAHPLREGCFAVLRPPEEWPPTWDSNVGLSRQALDAWFAHAPDDIVVVRVMHDGDAGNYAFLANLHGEGWTAYADDGDRIPAKSKRVLGVWATALRAMEDPELIAAVRR